MFGFVGFQTGYPTLQLFISVQEMGKGRSHRNVYKEKSLPTNHQLRTIKTTYCCNTWKHPTVLTAKRAFLCNNPSIDYPFG